MKKNLLILAAVLITVSGVFAQAPEKMSYQAVVRDNANHLVTDTEVSVTFSILDDIEGDVLWTEIQTVTTNANGLLTVELGSETALDASIFENSPLFIKTEIDLGSSTITGTSQLLSVPYAFHAKTAGEVISEDLWSRILHLEKVSGTAFITDADGNKYHAVTIGGTTWMSENLKTVSYNDGTPIPYVTDNEEWSELETGAYCIYPHDSIEGFSSNAEVLQAYGALYNWYAVNTGNLCPEGWRVSTDDDWSQLIAYLEEQGYDNEYNVQEAAAGPLKSCRQVNSPLEGSCNTTEHPRWNEYETRWGFDAYFFSALPGGWRYWQDGVFVYVGRDGRWWTSDSSSATAARAWSMATTSGRIASGNAGKPQGYSVRCVKK